MSGFRRAFVFGAILMLACGRSPSPAHSQSSAPSPAQLDKLVAPIALYPDPLVAQILPASTYPVEVIEAARALASGSRPSKATASQWDPSIQSLLSYPTVLKMMSDKINWTTQLGQAVAANQSAVMAAIQSVRRQAQAAGNLRSNDKQVVSVQGSGDSSTVVIEPANPQVIYVPQYNPVAILAPAPAYYYGDPAYGLMTFGVGFAAGAATAYACNWGYYGGSGSVTVNNNYHYNQSNVYHGYNSATGAHGAYNANTGNSASYHPGSGTYTGYDAKTGTYGAYNPVDGQVRDVRPVHRRLQQERDDRVPQPGFRLFRVAPALVVGRRALHRCVPRQPVQGGLGLRERVRRRRPGKRLPLRRHGKRQPVPRQRPVARRGRRIDERRIARWPARSRLAGFRRRR